MIRFLVVLLFVTNAVIASAQPVFTSTEFTSIFLKNVAQPTHHYFSDDTVALDNLVAISGDNVIWDFRAISMEKESDNEGDSVAIFLPSMPLASEFPTATHARIS